MWSLQSLFSNGHVWDSKFPMVFIPHECLRDANVKLKVQETIAHVVGWSLSCATSGVWPSSGPFGEVLSKHRKHQQGKPLAGGQYKACYFGYRADGKARRESHLFPRSFLHSFVCEQCLAQKEHKNWEPLMSYKCFYQSAAYRMTTISNPDAFCNVFFFLNVKTLNTACGQKKYIL